MPYVELHCHSAFSFLDGASHPAELAGAAAEHGYGALALTDHDGLYGAMELALAGDPLGVRAIAGAEVTLEGGAHITLLCENALGWRNLCRILTRAHAGTRPVPGREPLPPSVPFEVVERHAAGLVCLSGCARSGLLAAPVERGEHRRAVELGQRLLRAFGPDGLRVELQRPFARRDRRRNRRLAELAELLGVPCVATGNVHVHDRSRAPLQDVFVAARLRSTLDDTEPARRGNSSHALAGPEAMAERFRDHPEAVHESGRLADRLRFDVRQELGYRYPGAEDPEADRTLAELCRARVGERYAGRRTLAQAGERLEEELRVIRALGLSGFFLLHRDLLELAREVAAEVRGPSAARAVLPPGRGRGSSVASIVCYLTGLSHIDPVEKRLSLGRFLNDEITSLPDIDLDFPRDIREKLIPRVHERYGHERSALVASFACYQTRGAVRDIGKALGLPMGEIERVARTADPWGGGQVEQAVAESVGERAAATPRWRALVRLVAEAQNLARHLSQHPGGMVISTRPLVDCCPVQPAAMEGRQVLQWDKDSCSDAGFLKIDLLGLGMLSAVERCVDEIARTRGEVIDLSRIPFDDPEVYAQIQRAETTGVFQIESRAQMQMLVRTKPETLDDLTVQVALVRPGPIIGGAVHPYIERKKRLREDPSYQVPYEHPSLEPVLRDTLGAIVFQDQVIEVAMAFAGFTAGQAEGLRRAMSRKRSEAAMRAYEELFLAGAEERGASPQTAAHVFAQIVGFSGFGFPKSHSAAFGLLAYQSTWLRVHYGAEFLCGLLNEQPMGFYPPDALVHEAQRRGVEVLPPCVQRSAALCQVERGQSARGQSARRGDAAVSHLTPSRLTPAVRLGLGYVNGVRSGEIDAIVAERERGGPFTSAADLAARCASRRETLELLAWAGACDALCPEGGRREALWKLGIASPAYVIGRSRAEHASLPASLAGSRPVDGHVQLALPLDADAPALPDLTPWERMVADYGSTHVTLREHPLELMRPSIGPGFATSADLAGLPHGRRVKVAGLVVARQRPATANGITFMLLEDEHGTINLIVPPPVMERCRLAVRAEPLVTAEGRLEHREGNINILVSRAARLDRPDLPKADVKHIEPRRTWSSESGEDVGDLRAVAPVGHSFGRRGR